MITNFKLQNLLGEGGMSKVYLAENHIGKKVAIKILKEEFNHNDSIRNRFIQEAKHMIQINNPYFINIIDLIQEPEECAIVMEYFEGVTLKEFFAKNKKINDDQIKEIFLSMLNAVEGAHSLGIIHRDIKPSNFMIGINNTIKLMDFGIAKNMNNSNLEYTQTVINTNIGTPLYMSPEQVKGLGNVTYTTDIYSLGILLWEMVMGKSLYDRNLSINEINVKILNDSLPNTNSIFNNCICRATNKNTKDRFTTIKDFKLAFIKSFTNDKKYFTIFSSKQNNFNKNIPTNTIDKSSDVKIIYSTKVIFVIFIATLIVILTFLQVFNFRNTSSFSYIFPFIFIYILLATLFSSFSSSKGLIDFIENWNNKEIFGYEKEYNFENKLILLTQLCIIIFLIGIVLFYYYVDFYREQIIDIILITIVQIIFLIKGNLKNW